MGCLCLRERLGDPRDPGLRCTFVPVPSPQDAEEFNICKSQCGGCRRTEGPKLPSRPGEFSEILNDFVARNLRLFSRTSSAGATANASTNPTRARRGGRLEHAAATSPFTSMAIMYD